MRISAKGTKIVIAASIALMASCKDNPPTEPPAPTPNISGTWRGSGTKSGISYTITATLKQIENDTTITGAGEIAALIVTIPFSVTGANHYPDVQMMFTNPDSNFGTGTYHGTFDAGNDNAISGAATVPAFGIADEPLKLERK